ncbi:hypothetical protein MPC4_20058 [Methylocella tundrae]|uniref:Uncharacterized protein n=1 Tax=Methylocella tundrae TaxID=227605 RepID=A0A8B6M4S5_METTU|nr:hypothetical protein MPC4_20058 [Methylocella tundrae]
MSRAKAVTGPLQIIGRPNSWAAEANSAIERSRLHLRDEEDCISGTKRTADRAPHYRRPIFSAAPHPKRAAPPQPS